MKIIHAATELAAGGRKVCVAIGVFDGVHLGHQQIIRQTIADARQHDAIALVITFDRHPNAVVAPGRVPPLIYPLSQKIRVIESLAPTQSCWSSLTKNSASKPVKISSAAWCASLEKFTAFASVPILFSGHKRGGNVALLKKDGHGIEFFCSWTGRRFTRRPNRQQHTDS